MPLIAAATVFMFAGGIALVYTGWRGTPAAEQTNTNSELDRAILLRIVISVGLGIVALVLTRWVGLAVSVGGITFMMWGMYVDRADREGDRQRLRAMTGWLEMLRDSVSTGSGIVKAITVTSSRAPVNIAHEVRLLSARLDSMRLEPALWRFADDLDMPAADTAIAALVIATRHHGGNLSRLLSGVIDSTRQRVDQQARVEALRAQFTTASLLMVIVTSVTSILIVGGSAQFRNVYNSVIGQMVILIVGAIFMAAIWILRRMGRPRERTRLAGAPQT